jgi:carboxypeptidase Taq
MTAYQQLEDRFRRIVALSGAEAMLHWDSAAMMPPGGAEARAEQLATLGVIRHGLMTAPEFADLFAAADARALDPWRAANLREMERRWRHAAAVPADLVEALSRASSACEHRWRTARARNDFAGLRPLLAEVVNLTRQKAQAKAEALELSPYDALLDQYEPGGRADDFTPILARLEAELPGLLGEAIERQARLGPPLPLTGPFPVEAQRLLGERLMRSVGFDFEHGRLDVSHHPFTGGVPDDVRLTTRYDERDFARALMGVLHETGHAMYERGLPVDWRSQPVGDARGMILHESQSLIVEMQACRSDEFVAYLAPLAADAFGGTGPAWAPGNLARLYRQVGRGLIRVDADEVSYPLHVILRYRLERAMIAGELKVADLPGAWNEGMAKLIGATPPDDRDGCLQDIHWMGGDFGYFPTYTLGAIAAAQLFDAARRAEREMPLALARGDFAPLMGWLRDNVHRHGSRPASANELLTEATGRPLDVETFLRHLRGRYL